VDETEEERNLAFGPSENHLYEILQCGFFIILNAANHTALAHETDITKQLDRFAEGIQTLDKKYL